ncbi:MAG: RlmE family RNA methyltransferase [Oligoflexia bacterium]|nr:RlmE family RNA methyltransferase [Oligoflexia bacterium]
MGQYVRKDHLYEKAKEEGFRSRASYKLKELDQKHGLLKPGFKIIDLGAWPGGWLQVASERVGRSGMVVGIDLKAIEDLTDSHIQVITGDVSDDAVLTRACEMAGGRFDLVLSDMSPKLTGIREVDRYAAIGCADLALYAAGKLLRAGGNFVTKVFKSPEVDQFVKTNQALFNKMVRSELKSTRKSSNEFYLIGFGFKG